MVSSDFVKEGVVVAGLTLVIALIEIDPYIKYMDILLTKRGRDDVEESRLAMSIHQVQSHIRYEETCSRRL